MFGEVGTVQDSASLAGAIQCDLAVVGAGVAGLNALYAAAQYLPKSARVLLIDQKDGPAGMWNIAYDYVRLHQPYSMFTVGDLKWASRMPRDYRPGRDEVLDHLASSIDAVRKTVSLSTRVGAAGARRGWTRCLRFSRITRNARCLSPTATGHSGSGRTDARNPGEVQHGPSVQQSITVHSMLAPLLSRQRRSNRRQ